MCHNTHIILQEQIPAMNTAKLRIVSLLMALCLLFSVPALAEEPAPETVEISPVITQYATDTEMSFWQLENSLQVYCIPVGAQDCYMIVADGEAMVLDCAATGREPTADLLIKLCDALGIKRLKYALNTHPHTDHINGFPELLAVVPADEFLTCFKLKYDKTQMYILKKLRALEVPIREYKAGEPLPLGNAQIDTYKYKKSTNTNDLSLVVHVQYGERSILFTADIGLTAQRKMAVEFGEAWDCDILKLPHHGTGGLAKELYNTASPDLCFASNGPKSSSTKLQREFLQKRDCPLLFTSRQPLVMITDGETWEIQQWRADSIQLPHYTHIPEEE